MLYFYNRNIEVDFFVPDEDMAIQVSESIEDDDTRTREVDALVSLNKLHPLKKALIITGDEERKISDNGLEIKVMPIMEMAAGSGQITGQIPAK